MWRRQQVAQTTSGAVNKWRSQQVSQSTSVAVNKWRRQQVAQSTSGADNKWSSQQVAQSTRGVLNKSLKSELNMTMIKARQCPLLLLLLATWTCIMLQVQQVTCQAVTCQDKGPCRCSMSDGSGDVDISSLGKQDGTARWGGLLFIINIVVFGGISFKLLHHPLSIMEKSVFSSFIFPFVGCPIATFLLLFFFPHGTTCMSVMSFSRLCHN